MKNLKIIFFTIFITLGVVVVLGFLTHTKREYILERKVTAKAFIPVSNYNFGKVSKSDTIKYTFQIKNIGNTPIIIQKIASSCNCTKLSYDKKNIPINEMMEINAMFIPKKSSFGKETVSILIESNFDANITELKMEGFVAK